MKIRKAILFLLFAGLASAGIAAEKRGSGIKKTQDSIASLAADYEGLLKAPYFFTEGVKQADIHGDTTRAMAYFLAAIEADSTYAPAFFEAASTVGRSNPRLALEYSLRANQIDTANQWYRNQLGRLYLMTDKVEQARELYETEVKRHPRNPENYSMLAMIYQWNRQPYRAIMLLDSAENYLGRSDMLLSYKREILMSAGLYDRAIAESEAMIRDNPYDYANYLALGEIYAETNKDSLALANLEAARALNPSGVEIISALNDYYRSRGDIPNFFATAKQLILSDQIPRDTKIRFYEDMANNIGFYRDNFSRVEELAGLLLLKYPGEFDVMRIYAQSKIHSGNLEAALDFYKNNLNDTMPDIRVFNMILDMEAYLNRSDSVAKYASMAQRYFPDEPELYIRQGSALSYYMKSLKEAVQSYEKALKLVHTDSARSVIYGLIGDTYQSGGDTRKAVTNYEKSLELWADNILVLNNYSYYLSELGKDLERALEMSKKVMESEPGNATYIDTYGWILFKMGRYEESKAQLLRAISLDTTNSDEILIHYGDVLHALGEDFLAPIYWRKAAEAGYDKDKVEERLKKVEQK